jgi:hypothetical protein
MVRSSLALIALLMAVPALAQEPVGCDTFKWPLDTERTLLAKPSQAASGGEATLAAAVTLALVPFADAKLPAPPSRAPKFPDSYAGFVRVSALPKAGTYRITLSHGAWIDVVQDGQELKPGAFTGAKGCDGLAKSVKFELAATPFVIELSGTSAQAIGLVVTPD